MIRRITALVLTLLVLHLNLAGARDNCVQHDVKAGGTEAAMTHHTSSHSHGDASSHAGGEMHSLHSETHDTPPCEVPAQATCCTALLSCSIVFDVDANIAAGMLRAVDVV